MGAGSTAGSAEAKQSETAGRRDLVLDWTPRVNRMGGGLLNLARTGKRSAAAVVGMTDTIAPGRSSVQPGTLGPAARPALDIVLDEEPDRERRPGRTAALVPVLAAVAAAGRAACGRTESPWLSSEDASQIDQLAALARKV